MTGLRYGPCLCGDTSCSACFPTCNDPTECCICGAEFKQHETIECSACGNNVCIECAVDGMCKACADDARKAGL